MTISDIVTKTYFLTKTNVTSFPAADMLILMNNAYERVVSLIIGCDGRWQWDDSAQPITDQGDGTGGLPIATTALVANQQDYTLAVTHLEVIGMEVKDTNGNWTTLTPIDVKQIDHSPSATDFMKGTGIPVYYDKVGASILLYPAPNYSQAASLKIRFQREPYKFTAAQVSTGTRQPGFNSLYHDLIPLHAAYDYGVANGLPTINQIQSEIQRKEDALTSDYEMRSKDEQLRMRVVRNNPR